MLFRIFPQMKYRLLLKQSNVMVDMASSTSSHSLQRLRKLILHCIQ